MLNSKFILSPASLVAVAARQAQEIMSLFGFFTESLCHECCDAFDAQSSFASRFRFAAAGITATNKRPYWAITPANIGHVIDRSQSRRFAP